MVENICWSVRCLRVWITSDLPLSSEDVLIPSMKRYVVDMLVSQLALKLLRAPTLATRRSTESRFDHADLKHAALAINTADYCQTTALEVGFLQ